MASATPDEDDEEDEDEDEDEKEDRATAAVVPDLPMSESLRDDDDAQQPSASLVVPRAEPAALPAPDFNGWVDPSASPRLTAPKITALGKTKRGGGAQIAV
jgi:hypothetical protein